jgi:plastocyanin
MRAAVLVTLLLAGCSGGREEHVIRIEGMKFSPEVLTVKPGSIVVWQNTDIIAHTATALPRFDSGQIASQASFKVTLSEPGEIRYVCTIHPGMAGKIVVQ